MKINLVQTFIAIAISLLIAYGFYAFYEGEHNLLLSGGSFLFLATTLVTAIGVNFEQSRTNVNIKVVSWVFFVIALIDNIAFSFFDFSDPGYVITNGILLLLFILIAYSIKNV